MGIEGKCEKCGGVTLDYNCVSCLFKENEALKAKLEEYKDQGKTACELFDHLKEAQGVEHDLRELCRDAFRVIRDGITEDRVADIEVCILNGNLWRAANKIPLAFEPCGKNISMGYCNLRARHDGICHA